MTAAADTDPVEDRRAPAPPDNGRRADDSSALRFSAVGKQSDVHLIVRKLDVDIPRGTILGLVGPPGCGKTTTVRLETGTYRPDVGKVPVLGSDPAAMSTAQICSANRSM